LKKVIDDSTTIVGNFNIPLSIIDKTSDTIINDEIENLNNIINQLVLTDIKKTLHSIIRK
jgi:hypothetical protein